MILEVESELIKALQDLFKEKKFGTKSGQENIVISKIFSSYGKVDKNNIHYPSILIKFDEDTYKITKETEDISLKYHLFISTNASSKEEAFTEIIKIFETIKNQIMKTGRIGNIFVNKKDIRGILLEEDSDQILCLDMKLELGNTILINNLEEEKFYE